MICRGVQIVAARGLLRWSQMDLAEAAGLHRNAVAYWECVERIAASKYPPYAVRRIQGALERAGVKTFDANARRRIGAQGQQKEAGRSMQFVQLMHTMRERARASWGPTHGPIYSRAVQFAELRVRAHGRHGVSHRRRFTSGQWARKTLGVLSGIACAIGPQFCVVPQVSATRQLRDPVRDAEKFRTIS